MSAEVGLTSTILEQGRFHLAQYGQLITESVRNPDQEYNWVGTLFAANYWRLRGKAKESVDCLRKAIYYAPVQYKHIGLLALANVFHRSHNSEDALGKPQKNMIVYKCTIIMAAELFQRY